jgi:hypothetical protein
MKRQSFSPNHANVFDVGTLVLPVLSINLSVALQLWFYALSSMHKLSDCFGLRRTEPWTDNSQWQMVKLDIRTPEESNMSDIFKSYLAVLLLTSMSFGAGVEDHCVMVQHSRLQLSFPPTLQQIQASGICINDKCSIVATAYHVQISAGRANLSVAGGRTKQVLSAANESDASKTQTRAGSSPFFYDIANDVSFIYMTKSVAHKSGVRYSYKPYAGQRVIVAGYYHGKFEVTEAHIIGSNVPLIVLQMRLRENLVLDIELKPGLSGGAVLDAQGNLLGMVVRAGVLKRGQRLTLYCCASCPHSRDSVGKG